MNPRTLLLLSALGLALPACHGAASEPCAALIRAEGGPDASSMPKAACTAGEPASVCEVGSGGVSCNSVCTGGEYEMTCRSPDPSATPVPSPERALGCKALPLPSPNGVLFYCCPCSA